MTLGAVGFTCLYFTSAEQDWTAVFAVCLFSPLSRGGVGDHLSATTRTCINEQHNLGIQLLLHFKLQGQLGRNPCQSCQARKHETNSPRRGCGVKHRDKERESRYESPGLCLRVWNQVIVPHLLDFFFFFFFWADLSKIKNWRKDKASQNLCHITEHDAIHPSEEKIWADIICNSLCVLFYGHSHIWTAAPNLSTERQAEKPCCEARALETV